MFLTDIVNLFILSAIRSKPIFNLYFCCLAFFNLPGLFDELVKYLDKALPIALYYDHQDSFVQQSISNKIKEFYFDNHLTRDKDLNFTNVIHFEFIFQ